MMTMKQMRAESLPAKLAPVDCSKRHTAEVAAVITPPKTVAAAGRDSREMTTWVGLNCGPAINRYAGLRSPGTAAETTRTKVFTFSPSKKAWAKGERSIVCVAGSVEAVWSAKSKTWPLAPVTGSLKNNPGDSLRQIIPDGPNRETAWVLRGRYALTKSVTAPYPGEDALRDRAWNGCLKIVKATDGLGTDIPDEEGWRSGRTLAFCWVGVSYPKA